MATILQTIFSNGFCCEKSFVFDFKFRYLFLRSNSHNVIISEGYDLVPNKWQIIIWTNHYSDIIMSMMASQITSIFLVCSTICSGSKKKNQSSTSLAFLRGIHQWLVDSPHKGLVMQKMFPFDDAIIWWKVYHTQAYTCHQGLSQYNHTVRPIWKFTV